ncbi:hypothetical protein DYI21_01750 [Thalassospira tepidiphila]|nr:hypothetical protein [Thalassospira tepidiphila]
MVLTGLGPRRFLPDIKGFATSFKARNYQFGDCGMKYGQKRTPNLYEGPGREWEWENRLAAIIT